MKLSNCCFYIFSSFFLIINHVSCISELRACADEACSEILSQAVTVIKYHKKDQYTLSFDKNVKVNVYSKSAGSDRSYWGVEINGKRGYVPKMYLKEIKIYRDPVVKVPTEIFEEYDANYDKYDTKKYKDENYDKISKDYKKENDFDRMLADKHDVSGSRIKLKDVEADRTENLNVEHVVNKPAIFDGVSGEIVNDKIQATPPVLVIDGTTIHDSFADEEPIKVESVTDNKPQSLDKQPVKVESRTENNLHNTDNQSVENENQLYVPSIDKPVEEIPSFVPTVLPPVESPPESIINSSIEDSTIVKHLEEKPLNADFPKTVEDNISSVNAEVPKDELNVPSEKQPTPEISTQQLSQPGSHLESDVELKAVNSSESLEKESEQSLPLEIAVDSHLTNTSSEKDLGQQSQPEAVEDLKNESDVNKIPIDNKSKESPGIDESFNNLFNTETNQNVVPNLQPSQDTKESVVLPILTETVAAEEQKEFTIPSFHNEMFQPLVEQKIPVDFGSQDKPDVNTYLNQNYVNKEEPKIIQHEDKLVENINDPDKENITVDNIINANQNIHNVPSSSQSPESVTPFVESNYDPSFMFAQSQTTEAYTVQTDKPIIYEDLTTASPPIYQSIPPPLDSTNNEQKPDTNNVDHNNEFGNMFSSQPVVESVKESDMFSSQPVIESVKESDHSSNAQSSESEESFVSGILSTFSSMFGSVSNVFKSGDVEVEDNVESKKQWKEDALPGDVDTVKVGWKSFMASFLPAYSELPQCRPEENVIALTEVSTDLIMWLIISAVSVLAFTLGYYFLENRKQDGKLLAMVNSLQKELLCSTKECILLKDELSITKEKLIGIEDSSFGSNEMVACLKKEIADSQQTVADLQERLNQTEEELANSTEAALELQAILDEQLSSKDTSNSSLTFTVSNLQAQLDEQQTTMTLTKGQLAAKVEENELLMAKIVEMGNKTTAMEKELADAQKQMHQAREEYESKSQQFNELSATMEKSLQQLKEQKATEIKDLQQQLKNTKSELESCKVLLKARAHEVSTLQESLKMLKIDEKNIDTLINVTHSKAELTQVTTEKNILAEKLEKEITLLHELTNKAEVQENQMKEMREQLNEAEQKAFQATSRLEVLTNYFNQKEAELIKELNTKEALWLSQQGENMSTVEKIQSLQQEIQLHKDTTESVRRELLDQEAAWRARNAALERRAHDQWLARRAAERQAEAAQQEAQSLRHRLAAPSPVDKSQGMVSPLNSMEADLPLLPPPPMLFPPFPPLGGLPPPPFLPPPLHTHRPPTLGRLSSPPPPHMRHDRYSPDSRYSPDRSREYSPERRFTPQHMAYADDRVRWPADDRGRGYNNSRRYDDDDRYYESGDERRSHRRYDDTETDFSPPSSKHRRPTNHKGVSSGSGQSSESLDRINNKHSNKKY